MPFDPSLDIDATNGANIAGWPHVVQSLEQIFTTGFGDRIMREWFGSAVPRVLGENITTQTMLPFFAAMTSAIEQWEPRFRIVQITPESVGRDGRLHITIKGEYRPRALLGDFAPEGARGVVITGGAGALEVVGQNAD
ncbi:MAG: GPW/gp25 family protein [Roseovarius sp.]